jgi:hypothetical protein
LGHKSTTTAIIKLLQKIYVTAEYKKKTANTKVEKKTIQKIRYLSNEMKYIGLDIALVETIKKYIENRKKNY